MDQKCHVPLEVLTERNDIYIEQCIGMIGKKHLNFYVQLCISFPFRICTQREFYFYVLSRIICVVSSKGLT